LLQKPSLIEDKLIKASLDIQKSPKKQQRRRTRRKSLMLNEGLTIDNEKSSLFTSALKDKLLGAENLYELTQE
jgi:hypothetical protein